MEGSQSLGSGTSKKRSRASRTVAGLSDEQIRHKRTVDRKAQRAFRQRTKDFIGNLERQFAQLQETCAQQEMELSTLREQNKSLQQRLDSIRDILSGNQTVQIDSDIRDRGEPTIRVYAGEKVRDDGSLSPDNEIPSSPVVVHASSTPDGASTPFEPDRDLYTSDPAISHGHTPEASPNMDPLPETTGQGANTGNTIADGSYQGVGAIEASNDPSPLSNMPSSQAIPDATHTGADVGVSPAQGGTMAGVEPHNAFPTPNSVIMAGGWQAAAQKAAFNTLPVYLPAERPLDQILFDFIQSRRGALPDGTASETSLWPQKPKMQALVNPDMIQTVDSLSAIMSRVLSTFRHVNLPEKLAFFYIMYHTARWLIQPIKEHYLAMPSWLRPTVTQITVPHAIWIDNIPWPGVRDLLIENQEEYPFEVFSELYSHNVTVNWQFGEMDAISSNGDDTALHSIFEKHIRNIGNWTVSSEFQSRLPAMTSSIYSL